MCLTITVEVAGLSELELGSLAREVSTAELAFATQGRGLLRRHEPRPRDARLRAARGGRRLERGHLVDANDGERQLSAALERLFQRTSGDIRVAAIFGGDHVETEQVISQHDLLRIAAAGEPGTKTQYVVASEEPAARLAA
jgi:hypothetical protein